MLHLFNKKRKKVNTTGEDSKKKSKTLAKIETGVDKPFLIITSLLVIVGLIIFSSAIIMLIGSVKYDSVRFNQYGLGLIGGLILMYTCYKIPISFWRSSSFYIYIGTIILMILVFVPHVGILHGGSKRWIQVLGFSFQPAEIYKIGVVLYMALWLMKDFGKKLDTQKNFYSRTLPLVCLLAVSSILFLLQPDTDMLAVICVSLVFMYLLAGGNYKDIFVIGIIGILGLAVIVFSRPYVMKRFEVFINPSADPTGSGYQFQQSLIAIGSGGIVGRGYGQSIQKFKYLPEPIGDSIFAVSSEDFGFIGSTLLILLYIIFLIRGFKIAAKSSSYGSLVIVGLICLIVMQSFENMSSMLGMTPLSGTPLIFVSQGGTSLLISLMSIGVILSASREKKVGVK
jgi:cell division protein FtsW